MAATAIVGAGAAGLSLGLMLPDAVVFEAEKTPGGLCRSTMTEGFTWDAGPHILGGIPEAVEWVRGSSRVEFIEGRTVNVCFIGGEWRPHPMEDQRDVDRYMRKMWKHDHLLQPGLGAQRGRRPGGVASFSYPKRGGYQSITDSWADQLGDRLRLSSPVDVIDLLDDFDEIVWTGPRPGGHYNILVTATAMCAGEPPPYTAIYLPGAWTPFHRLSFPAAFSRGNAPPDSFAVQAERSFAPDTTPYYTVGELEELLSRIGIRDCVETVHQTYTFAYPVPIRELPNFRDGTGITFHGRTGAHRYLNLDGVVAESMALAERLSAQ